MLRSYYRTNRTKNPEIAKKLKALLKEDKDENVDEYNLVKKSLEIKKYKDIFRLLGYNLNPDQQFHYAEISGERYVWKTTQQGKYFVKHFNAHNTIKHTDYKKVIFDINDHILKHIYPMELKRATSFNSKWIDDKDKINAHYVEMMIGADLKYMSDILVLDIDCHDGDTLRSYQDLQSIVKYFNYQYLYLECSAEGGYHLFIKLDKQYPYENKKNFFKTLKPLLDLNHVEVVKKLRLPFSFHYEPCSHEMEIFSIEDSIQSIKENYEIQIGFELTIETKSEEDELPSPVVISKIYSREKNNKYFHKDPNHFIQTTPISISRGHRYYEMLEIVRIGKISNWSINEICYVIRSLDKGSKDLSKWNDIQLSAKVKNIYDASIIQNTSSSQCPEEFISNIDLLPNYILRVLSDDVFIDTVIKKSKHKITELNRRKFRLVLSEMIGHIYYDSKNKRTTLNNHKSKFLIGKQFSEQYAKKMKTHYEYLFKSIDTHSIIISILKHSGLFTQYKHTKRGWQYNKNLMEYNFCKQFDLVNNIHHLLLNNINIIDYLLINLIKLYYKYNIINTINIYKMIDSLLLNIPEIFEKKDRFFNQFLPVDIDIDDGLLLLAG